MKISNQLLTCLPTTIPSPIWHDRKYGCVSSASRSIIIMDTALLRKEYGRYIEKKKIKKNNFMIFGL